MSGSIESAKDVVKDAAKEKAPRAARSAPKIVAESAPEAKPAVEAAAKPVAIDVKPAATMAARKPVLRSLNLRYAAVAAGALVVGTGFGMVTAPKPSSNDGLAQVVAALESGRAESARLNGEIERLNKSVTTLAQATEASRSEGKSLGASLYERMTKLEQGLDKKLASLGEKIDREQAAHVTGTTTPVEKRAAAPVPPTPIPPQAVLPAAKSEPTQTGSISEPKSEAKPKPETVESWAVRDVYNGIAMLEDRRRRLIEVAPGDAVPGVGRVEAVERRGRTWVVVTKQGLITPQAW